MHFHFFFTICSKLNNKFLLKIFETLIYFECNFYFSQKIQQAKNIRIRLSQYSVIETILYINIKNIKKYIILNLRMVWNIIILSF